MPRLISFVSVLLSAALVWTAQAVAQEWGPPRTEYSATLTYTDGRGEVLVHRLFHTPQRQRLDYTVKERQEAVIVDREAATIYVLFPAQKLFRKSPMVEPEFDLGIGRESTKREKLGSETVADLPADKYRVEAQTAQGQVFTGLAWLTKENILVKLEGEVKQGRRTRKLSMIASDVRIGPLDPALFKVPDDYRPIEAKR